MNIGMIAGILALLFQGADAPKPDMETAKRLAREYRPEAVYGGAGFVGDSIGYQGGMYWQTGKRWGVGLEYRENKAEFSILRQDHEMQLQSGGVYLFRYLPKIGNLKLRTDAGAGVVFGKSETIDANECLGLSARIVGILPLNENIGLMLSYGGVFLSNINLRSDSRSFRADSLEYVENSVSLVYRF